MHPASSRSTSSGASSAGRQPPSPCGSSSERPSCTGTYRRCPPPGVAPRWSRPFVSKKTGVDREWLTAAPRRTSASRIETARIEEDAKTTRTPARNEWESNTLLMPLVTLLVCKETVMIILYVGPMLRSTHRGFAEPHPRPREKVAVARDLTDRGGPGGPERRAARRTSRGSN